MNMHVFTLGGSTGASYEGLDSVTLPSDATLWGIQFSGVTAADSTKYAIASIGYTTKSLAFVGGHDGREDSIAQAYFGGPVSASLAWNQTNFYVPFAGLLKLRGGTKLYLNVFQTTTNLVVSVAVMLMY